LILSPKLTKQRKHLLSVQKYDCKISTVHFGKKQWQFSNIVKSRSTIEKNAFKDY